jgi:hypothetical protein
MRYQGKVNAVNSVFWLPLCFDYCRYLVRVLGFSPFRISGWTVTGKSKDMTILESDIAKGWLAKLCTTIVGMFGWILRIFGEESGRYEFSGKDQYSAPSVSVTVWVRHLSPLILFSMELLWIPNYRKNLHIADGSRDTRYPWRLRKC